MFKLGIDSDSLAFDRWYHANFRLTSLDELTSKANKEKAVKLLNLLANCEVEYVAGGDLSITSKGKP